MFVPSSFLFLLVVLRLASCTQDNVHVFTVATEANDGYRRFIRSARHYGIEVQTLGMDSEWKGGDMNGRGGGYKVNLLRDAVEKIKDDQDAIVLFTDSYDVVFTNGLDDILSKFSKIGAKVLFGAEHYLWPDKILKDQYPTTVAKGARYLNSGLFIGYAPQVYEILKKPIKDTDDDQLYYTKSYLDKELRDKLKIQLDHKSEIFQNLNGATADVKLDIDPTTGQGVLKNVNFLTRPSVIHGNGPSKLYLNAFANYLAGAFINNECPLCKEDNIEIKENAYPIVSMSVFVEKPMPFFEEFLDGILSLNYPKSSINLFIHCNVPYHDKLVNKYVLDFGVEYKTVKLLLSADNIDEKEARKLAVQQAKLKESDYLFYVEAEAHIDDHDLLIDLIKLNRSIIAPVLVRDDNLWSNFWAALDENGFYARSHDYLEIVKGSLKGMWNVPYIGNCYLVKSNVFDKLKFDHKSFDPDMAMCEHLRDAGVFMYIINTKTYGHLVNDEDFNLKNTRPDFYTFFTNQRDWEQRYIHPDYAEQFNPNFTHKQPCPDVYWIPIVTEKFCKDLVAIMEAYGKWSDGSNHDKRLDGGYEAVPTRDIHMNQVGLEKFWLKFLQKYVRPLQELIFVGYFHNPPRAIMNFVVRYKPDEQPSLRPHHDSSTYTVNIALNRAGIDFEGGGCRFIRYNCSIRATEMGWMLLHPGRLTHFHEGLQTTKGIRYIMVSFVDP
ncbi:procollagen-lysine,2-oxoglutarate 5-dioxygenase [Hermetia illucens]|nr:procollagen-lysine,2-oxoglutarate 5-dioxygenase [Hermetia illucens]